MWLWSDWTQQNNSEIINQEQGAHLAISYLLFGEVCLVPLQSGLKDLTAQCQLSQSPKQAAPHQLEVPS